MKTTGSVDSVPCPWCGTVQDLTDLQENLDTGTEITCDNCDKIAEVVAMRAATKIWLQRRP